MSELTHEVQAGVAIAEQDVAALRKEAKLVAEFVEGFVRQLPIGVFEDRGFRVLTKLDGLELVLLETGEPFAACRFDPRTIQFLFEFPIGGKKYPLPANTASYPVLARYLGIAIVWQEAYEEAGNDERFRPVLRLERPTLGADEDNA